MWLLFLATYPWAHADDAVPLHDRIAPPPGYKRVKASDWGEWLRGLPTLPGRPDVLLHDGTKKRNQHAQHLVLDIDVGKRDLQQCADAVIRLRAEYLFEKQQPIAFHYTDGTLKRVTATSHAAFRKAMDDIFTYAGTRSLERELTPVAQVEPGDVLIVGGSPGHAMLVVDVAEHTETLERIFLLLQSYMPAQQMHVVINPGDSQLSPWYRLSDPLRTAEWTFKAQHLRRFP